MNDISNILMTGNGADDPHARSALSDLAKKYEHLLRESEARFNGAFDCAPIGMALISLDGKWLKANQSLCDIVGYSEAELLTMRIQDLTHSDDQNVDQTFVQLVLADQLKTYQMETRYLHKDGHIVPVMFNSSLVRSADGKPLYFISKIEDITQRKQMEDALFAEKDLAQTTLESIGDAVITVDVNAIVTYLNPVAERLTGWTNQDAIGVPLEQVFVIVNENTRATVESPARKALSECKMNSLAGNTILIGKDGTECFIDNSAAPIRVKNGNLSGVVMVFHDVTEARTQTAKVTYQASHDALTGLWNRTEFELTAMRLLHSAKTLHQQHALLYLDLDQFKIVNDTCGHLAGDQLLRQLSNLLLSNTRKSDTLARLGGDEFGILLDGCPPGRAKEIAQHLIDTVRSFRFEWEDKFFSVGVSIGLVAINDQTTNLVTLLSGADSACYMAKNMGRNRIHVFEESGAGEQIEQKPHVHIDWVARLLEAIAHDDLFLYFQKIQSIGASPAQCHYEILLRYRDAQGRFLLPMAFIPAAERYGLLATIDRWVIRTVLRNPPLDLPGENGLSFFALNLSSSSIIDPDFLKFVAQELQASSLPAHRICFEIAETTAISNLQQTIHFIQTLKPSGCQFALDDFGGSMSSYNYLRSLMFDYLKIDGSIVKNIVDDVVDYAMVESIHRIGKVMGFRTIAKYVENDAILNQLQKIGVDYQQGFGLHTPEIIPRH